MFGILKKSKNKTQHTLLLIIHNKEWAYLDPVNKRVTVDKVMALLQEHLGTSTEIVFHDLTLPYEHTIVDIRNGELTGRTIGGCGSNLGLEVIAGKVKNGDRFNYITHTKTGRILRSSTIYLYEEGKVTGSICVNTDISDTIRMESVLREYNGYNVHTPTDRETEEHFAQNVSELLEQFMQDAQKLVGKPAPLMKKGDKMKFIAYLDAKGAFLITKSSEHVCEFIGISKYTLYNYLDSIRAHTQGDDKSSGGNT
jgi:predicted transcriptional regulator YheO